MVFLAGAVCSALLCVPRRCSPSKRNDRFRLIAEQTYVIRSKLTLARIMTSLESRSVLTLMKIDQETAFPQGIKMSTSNCFVYLLLLGVIMYSRSRVIDRYMSYIYTNRRGTFRAFINKASHARNDHKNQFWD
jgi:hypothetical protein